MKTIFQGILTACLLCLLTLGTLPAQTPMQAEAPAANSNAPKTEIDRRMAQDKLEADNKRLELERRMALDKLETEKNMHAERWDKGKSMVHDLAWNSWVLVVLGAFWFGYLRRKMQLATIRELVEKGVPITPELVGSLKRRDRSRATAYDPYGYLAWGFTLVAVGIGVLIVAGKAGWIVILIGVADLLLWVVDSVNRKN